MSARRIANVTEGQPTIEGAGVHLRRAFGYYDVPKYDPFLMLDDFHTSNPQEYLPGFPWHPHRGIETVTYVIEGIVEHDDSMENSGVIGAGDVQWMTAGSGIIHQEMPKISPTGMLWGIQLWCNLPAAHKMMQPRYRDVKANTIPTSNLAPGVNVKVISGVIDGVTGPVQDIVTSPTVLDVQMTSGCMHEFTLPEGHTAVIYVLSGAATFEETVVNAQSVILYDRAGDSISVVTGDHQLRFLLLTGKPLEEPVAWRGPIVMNSKEELQLAFDELTDGNFVKTTA
ncbi:MAG: pirin family protein [Armatimonadota bacterium]